MAERPENTLENWFRYFQYEEGRDSPGDTRNVLLIVASLIAGVTFQAGLNPPGGHWQDDEKGHKAGRAIYSDRPIGFHIFLIFNTMALSTSILIILCLTYKFPLRLEIMIANLSIGVTYASAIFAVAPGGLVKFWYILVVALAPLVIRVWLQWFNGLKVEDTTTDRERDLYAMRI